MPSPPPSFILFEGIQSDNSAKACELTSSIIIRQPLRRSIPFPVISARTSSSLSKIPLQRISGLSSNQSRLLTVASNENSHVATARGSLAIRREKPSDWRREIKCGTILSNL